MNPGNDGLSAYPFFRNVVIDRRECTRLLGLGALNRFDQRKVGVLMMMMIRPRVVLKVWQVLAITGQAFLITRKPYRSKPRPLPRGETDMKVMMMESKPPSIGVLDFIGDLAQRGGARIAGQIAGSA